MITRTTKIVSAIKTLANWVETFDESLIDTIALEEIQLGKKRARVTHDTVRTSHGTRDLVVVLQAGGAAQAGSRGSQEGKERKMRMKHDYMVRIEDTAGQFIWRVANDGVDGMLTEQQALVVARGLNEMFCLYKIQFCAKAEQQDY